MNTQRQSGRASIPGIYPSADPQITSLCAPTSTESADESELYERMLMRALRIFMH
jgi:hypothetical protein